MQRCVQSIRKQRLDTHLAHQRVLQWEDQMPSAIKPFENYMPAGPPSLSSSGLSDAAYVSPCSSSQSA